MTTATLSAFDKQALQDSADIEQLARQIQLLRWQRDTEGTTQPYDLLSIPEQSRLQNVAAIALRSLDRRWVRVAEAKSTHEPPLEETYGFQEEHVDEYLAVLSGLTPLTPDEQATVMGQWRRVLESPQWYAICPDCWTDHHRTDVEVVAIEPDGLNPRTACGVCNLRVDGTTLEVL